MNNTNKGEDGDIIAQAAGWHAASDGDGMDWNGFTIWLEADARHRLAYDEVALTDQLIIEHRSALRQVEPTPSTVRPRRCLALWLPVGLAAAAAAIFAIFAGPALMRQAEQSYVAGAAPQAIALTEGSRVILGRGDRCLGPQLGGGHGEPVEL